MQYKIARMLLVFGVPTLIGCAQRLPVDDSFTTADLRMPLAHRIRAEANAAVIVLGTITSVEMIGAPTVSHGDPRVKVQLTNVTIRVEAVIRGSVPDDSLAFYFFEFSRENARELGVPTYYPDLGQRRIFFLNMAGGRLRSVGDVTDYSLPVWTGMQPAGACNGKTPGCCMAEMLLEPRSDVNVAGFTRELGIRLVFAAGILCSPRTAQDLTMKLTQNPNREISKAAGEVMSYLPQWWPELRTDGGR